jgi:SAM-dependent methyltransferase
VRPVLVEPQPTACVAARSLFHRPVACADATVLPIGSGSVDVAWCLGVLCTVEDRADQGRLLAELRRVVGPGGRVGLLVLTARQTPVPDPPVGNNFPSLDDLDDLLAGAGLDLEDAVDTSELAEADADWTRRTEQVEAALRARYGGRSTWQTAQQQSERIGELFDSGVLATRLLVARPEVHPAGR